MYLSYLSTKRLSFLSTKSLSSIGSNLVRGRSGSTLRAGRSRTLSRAVLPTVFSLTSSSPSLATLGSVTPLSSSPVTTSPLAAAQASSLRISEVLLRTTSSGTLPTFPPSLSRSDSSPSLSPNLSQADLLPQKSQPLPEFFVGAVSTHPVCDAVCAYTSGWLSHAAGKCETHSHTPCITASTLHLTGFPIVVTEVRCRAMGDKKCVFIAANQERTLTRAQDYLRMKKVRVRSCQSMSLHVTHVNLFLTLLPGFRAAYSFCTCYDTLTKYTSTVTTVTKSERYLSHTTTVPYLLCSRIVASDEDSQ